MSTLHRKLPSVHGTLGCNLPKPARTFGQGITWTDEPPDAGRIFWTDELVHLESLLENASPARTDYIRRRIDGVLNMLDL